MCVHHQETHLFITLGVKSAERLRPPRPNVCRLLRIQSQSSFLFFFLFLHFIFLLILPPGDRKSGMFIHEMPPEYLL